MLESNPLKKLILLCFLSIIASCKDGKTDKFSLPQSKIEQLKLDYASGFSITQHNNYSILEINNPWPNATKKYKYVLISSENAAKTTFMKGEYDGIIIKPIKNIVVTSTTHIPALELLNVEKSLVAFPGTDYISSKKIRERIDAGFIRELGKTENLNTEVLLELNPNLVVGFGIDGNNRAFETIKNAGIPVIYNGDWVENSPLAKAEWIKFFGALFDKQELATTIFNDIKNNYLEAKKIAKKAKQYPTVLSGAMHSDVWYLPNGNSTETQLLNDAHVHYLWKDTKGSGSLKLNFESVFVKAKKADIWLNPSNYTTLEALKAANKNHTAFDAFKYKNIYSFTNTIGKTGGVLYYELGTTRPDLVLKDIIKICHPELLEDYKPFFFKPLK